MKMVSTYMVVKSHVRDLSLCPTGYSKVSVSTKGQSLELREKQLEGQEKAQFLHFMRKMLAWLPEERPSAEELLFDDWVRGDDY